MTTRDPKIRPGQATGLAGRYGIAVTSDLVGTGVQNLRAYEKAACSTLAAQRVGPVSIAAMMRPDSRRIQALLAQGLNPGGHRLGVGTRGRERTPSLTRWPTGGGDDAVANR